jgi:hypothetical protein
MIFPTEDDEDNEDEDDDDDDDIADEQNNPWEATREAFLCRMRWCDEEAGSR